MRSGKSALYATLGLTLAVTTACGSDGGSGDGEETYELTYSSYVPETTAIFQVQSAVLDAIEEKSDGRITFDRYFSGSLCSAEESLACVQDGRADAGYTITGYYPGVFPASEIAVLPFLMPNNQAVTAGFHELYDDNEIVKAEWDKAGIRPIVMMGSDHLFIGATKLIEKPSDLKGLTMRVTGDQLSNVFAAADANVTPLAPPEIYEAVERGTLDGWASNFDFIAGYSIDEVTKKIANPGVGNFSALPVVFSKKVYDGLPEDLQQVIDEVSDEFTAGGRANEMYNDLQVEGCDKLIEQGLIEEFITWPESETQAWKDASWDTITQGWIDTVTKSGASEEDAQALLEQAEGIAANAPDVEDSAAQCPARYMESVS